MKNVEALCGLMKKNYEYMKLKAGLIDGEVEERDKLKVDEIFEKLRPDSPYKLSEMLQPSFNPKKKLDSMRKEGKGTINICCYFLGVSKGVMCRIVEGTPDDVKQFCMYNTDGRRSSSSIFEKKYRRSQRTRPASRQEGGGYLQESYHRSLITNTLVRHSDIEDKKQSQQTLKE